MDRIFINGDGEIVRQSLERLAGCPCGKILTIDLQRIGELCEICLKPVILTNVRTLVTRVLPKN